MAAQDTPLFDLDPSMETAALRAQRNEAMDEAARWRAVAHQQERVVRSLSERLSVVEAEIAAASGGVEISNE